MKKFLCIIGFHEYDVLDEGDVGHNGMIVGRWTWSRCCVCGKSRYKQYV